MRKLLRRAHSPIILVAGVMMMIVQGCATTKESTPSYYYLQRDPVSVAVMPSVNNTERPDAAIIFNKACEEAFLKRGYKVVNADQVVTYASSIGKTLKDVTESKASQLGRDLKVDLILYSDISTWGQSYSVLNTSATVAGKSRLVETSTDALVWSYNWMFQQQSGDGGGNGLLGMMLEAAVTAVMNSATDVFSTLGTQAALNTVNSTPRPGFAPPVDKTAD